MQGLLQRDGQVIRGAAELCQAGGHGPPGRRQGEGQGLSQGGGAGQARTLPHLPSGFQVCSVSQFNLKNVPVVLDEKKWG